MGNSSHHKGVRLHVTPRDEHRISYIDYMLSVLSDFLDSQIRLLEAKGAWILIPIFGIQAYIFSWFANIQGVQNTFDIVKNIILSLIGIAMGVMGVINTYIATKKKLREYLKDKKDEAA